MNKRCRASRQRVDSLQRSHPEIATSCEQKSHLKNAASCVQKPYSKSVTSCVQKTLTESASRHVQKPRWESVSHHVQKPRKKDTRKINRPGRKQFHAYNSYCSEEGCLRSKAMDGKPFRCNFDMERHMNSIHRKKQGLPIIKKFDKHNEEKKCDLCGWLGNGRGLKAHRGSDSCIKRACMKKSPKYQ